MALICLAENATHMVKAKGENNTHLTPAQLNPAW